MPHLIRRLKILAIMAVAFGISSFLSKDYFINGTPMARLPFGEYVNEKYISLSSRFGSRPPQVNSEGEPLTPSDPGYVPEPTQSFIANWLPWTQPTSETPATPSSDGQPTTPTNPDQIAQVPRQDNPPLNRDGSNPGIETHTTTNGQTETVVHISELAVDQMTFVSASGQQIQVEYPKGQEPPPQELLELLAR